MRFWLVCVFLLICLELTSVSEGRRTGYRGGRRRQGLKKRLRGEVDELKEQVEKLRECLNDAKGNILELKKKLALLEKLCQCRCRDHNGKCYAVGQTFTAKDGCNTCTCQKDGSVACTEIGCPPPTPKPEPTPPPCLDICAAIYDPVCGTDGKTYGNQCNLDAAICKCNKDDKCQPKLKLDHSGECILPD